MSEYFLSPVQPMVNCGYIKRVREKETRYSGVTKRHPSYKGIANIEGKIFYFVLWDRDDNIHTYDYKVIFEDEKTREERLKAWKAGTIEIEKEREAARKFTKFSNPKYTPKDNEPGIKPVKNFGNFFQ